MKKCCPGRLVRLLQSARWRRASGMGFPRRRRLGIAPTPSEWLALGHTLVIANKHAVGVQDVSPAGMQAVALLAQRIAQQMKDAIGANGVNVLNARAGLGPVRCSPSLSAEPGRRHVVPRWRRDVLDTWLNGGSTHRLEFGWMRPSVRDWSPDERLPEPQHGRRNHRAGRAESQGQRQMGRRQSVEVAQSADQVLNKQMPQEVSLRRGSMSGQCHPISIFITAGRCPAR